MVWNLCCNQFISGIFYRGFILTPIMLMLLIINQQTFASNNNTTKEASLENLVNNNYYNIYLSNSVTYDNISYYSFFQPKIKNSTENIWSGMLVAFFVDDDGNLREDSNGNLHLDNTDAVINLSYDLATENIKVTKSAAHSSGFNPSNYSINEVSAVWHTDNLATVADNTSKLGAKKYNEISLDKRYMFTQIDNKLNLLLNNICTLNYKYFDLDIISCNKVINYLYGKPDNTQRSKIKSVSAQDRKIINLGDIAHSELVIAGKPKANYDYLYQDASYAKFKKLYQYRRKVLYVGANDGMLHAFNAGFHDVTNTLSLTGKVREAEHPLGSELWAYAPTNLLPHLKYLTSENYNHKFFVDGSLQIVDAQIFSADEYHPDGWGTVLIAATGLGGSFINLAMVKNKQEFSSAYILLDITNPEVSPQVIAEISHKQLGFTLSKPAIIRRKIHSSNNKNQASVNHNWYLVFASGLANNLESFNTDNNLKIFIYDLTKKALVSGFNPKVTQFSNCYAGDMQKTDWNNSNEDDFIYFGALYTNNNIVANSSILRLKLATSIAESTVSTLATNLKPIVKAPLLVRDKNDYWIFAGSGRLLTKQDILSIGNQFIYGIREPLTVQGELSLATVDANKLVDVTDVEISTTGAITSKQEGSRIDLYIDNNKITEFQQLEKNISDRQGWKLNLDNQDVPGYLQLQPQRVASLILFPEFKPRKYNYFVGDRYVHILHYKTGTSSIRYQVKPSDDTKVTNNNLAVKKVYAGIGYSSSNYIQIKTSVKNGTKILIPNSSKISIDPYVGEANTSYSRLSWRKIK